MNQRSRARPGRVIGKEQVTPTTRWHVLSARDSCIMHDPARACLQFASTMMYGAIN
jgi:hypothetical protein